MMHKSLGSYRRVYGLLWQSYGRTWQVRVSFVLVVLKIISKFVALPIVASQIIASVSVGDFERAKMLVLVFALFSAIIGVLTPLIKYIGLMGENKIYDRALSEYFKQLIGSDIQYFNNNLTGYVTAATRQYSDSCIDLLRKLRDSYLSTVLAILLPVVVIFTLDIRLGIVTAALSIVQAAYLFWASQLIAPYRVRTRETYKEVSGYIADAISNVVTVKAAAQEAATSRMVERLAKKETSIFIERYKAQTRLIAARECITVTFFLALFWLTVDRVSAGGIDIAGVVLVVTYSFMILSGIYTLSDMLEEHDDYLDKILPAFEILDRKNTVTDPPRPVALGEVRGAVNCQNVDFSYMERSGKTVVFKDFNLKIPAGQKIGVVGLSGAGKSTLTKLLLRFEDVDAGQVLIDGVNVKDAAQADVRKNVAYVPQEPLLFHRSIGDNIRFARPDASQQDIIDAARAAYAWNFIETLPDGLDSIVGERGVKLSGGQKQRVAIARAVLQNAPVIILDEATSALDSESEQIIKASFARILKGKTAIVVAHRLSTLSDMDRIVVIDAGKIVEDGSHRQLIKNAGLYAKLWNRQQRHPEDAELPLVEATEN